MLAQKWFLPIFKTIVEEGKKLAAIHPNIVVKVPMIKDGVKAINGLPITE
jgi:transaldolase